MTDEEPRLESLIRELIQLPRESEWVEFKENKCEPGKIGEDIAALSNSAFLKNKPQAYYLWGVSDSDHSLTGTSFHPFEHKVGNEHLENWLATQLDPRIQIRFHELSVDGFRLILLIIQAATHLPISFKGEKYVRIGSYTKKLREHPEVERELWRKLDAKPIERSTCMAGIAAEETLKLLNYPSYFQLMDVPLPHDRDAIMERLLSDRIVQKGVGGLYDITIQGALLFANRLSDFDLIARKALRIVIYHGTNRVSASREILEDAGYASSFQTVLHKIIDQLPQNEVILQALRQELKMYPEIAIRELVANSLVHQDFTMAGTGPMVEIFSDRMEISNPGVPLVNPLRFIDDPPHSRNESLAGMMRRMRICEERGSGIDKVIFHVEFFQLPPPDFRVASHSTVVTLLAHKPFAKMDREERIRACYQHASLCHVSGDRMTNASLRKRLGIKDSNYPQVSRIIRETKAVGLIKSASSNDSGYLPFWA